MKLLPQFQTTFPTNFKTLFLNTSKSIYNYCHLHKAEEILLSSQKITNTALFAKSTEF